jgi:17 kDa outer membrane surface antigen
VSRTHYSGRIGSPNRFRGLALINSILLAGCSLNLPTFGAFEAPATTGSLGGRVDVEEPLPTTLAYSDARTIGEAAAAALWQAGGDVEDWVNAATGSSGTLQPRVAPSDAEAGGCRSFDTIVTSIGGVHHYSGRVCPGDEGRSVLRIDPGEDEGPS